MKIIMATKDLAVVLLKVILLGIVVYGIPYILFACFGVDSPCFLTIGLIVGAALVGILTSPYKKIEKRKK